MGKAASIDMQEHARTCLMQLSTRKCPRSTMSNVDVAWSSGLLSVPAIAVWHTSLAATHVAKHGS